MTRIYIGTEHLKANITVRLFVFPSCVCAGLFVLFPSWLHIKSKGGMQMIVSEIKNQNRRKENKVKHKNFFMVSNRIFELELKPRDFAVYCCLLRHSDNENGSCFPSRRVIAKECGIDRKTVDSAIESLSVLGLIKKVHRHRENGTRTSNLYYVTSLLE